MVTLSHVDRRPDPYLSDDTPTLDLYGRVESGLSSPLRLWRCPGTFLHALAGMQGIYFGNRQMHLSQFFEESEKFIRIEDPH